MENNIFKNLSINLSTGAKIAIVVIAQALIIIIVLAVVSAFTKEPERIFVDENNQQTNIPDAEWKGIKDRIWTILSNRIENLDRNEIDGVVIREGTYSEKVKDSKNGKIHDASFLVDIDSLKQTYDVKVSWADSSRVEFMSSPIYVECPKKSQMKYPETFCYGINTTTASPEIYLPYTKYKGDEGDYYYTIQLSSYGSNQINVIIRDCDFNKNKEDAEKYLKSTGIELDKYNIVYKDLDTDRICPN